MSLNRKLDSRRVLKRIIIEYVAPHRNRVYLAIFFMVVAALCATISVTLVKPAVDKALIQKDQNVLHMILFGVFIVYTVKGVAEYFQSYLVKYLGQQILTKMQMQMYQHLLSADFLFIQAQSSGRLISRFTNDIVLMRGAVSNMLVGAAKHFLSVLFLIILMFSLDPYLSAFIFFVFPLAIIPVQKLGRRMRVITGQAQEELSNFTAKLDESFSAIRIIKSFCTEQKEITKARKITDETLAFYRKAAKLDSLTSPLMEILTGLAISAVLGYGGYKVIQNEMTTGSLFAFITAFVSAYRPFKSLVSLNVNLQEGLAAANRVFNILDIEPSIKDSKNSLTPKIDKPEINFQDISVQINGRSAIKSLNVKVAPGSTYAFVGRSGSGKTTMANILNRFIDPTSGNILIDQVNIKDINLKHLRKAISLVTQDVLLFDMSIASNIAYGIENASREDIIKAAKAADAHDFISALPQGYDSLVGNAGSNLSGGQKQRISIARAFLKNAPILLLDEATSSLDPKSEQSIIESINQLRKNRTTIIITHRLGSIQDADQIIVMKQGKIVEQGTHQSLLEMKKEYYRLHNTLDVDEN